jgi:hypothetical protein
MDSKLARMKNVFFVFMLVAFASSAQKIEINLNWTDPYTYNIGEEKFTNPHFDEAQYRSPLNKIPYFIGKQIISSYNVSEVSLVNVSTAGLSSREQSLLNEQAVSNEFELDYSVTGLNGRNYLAFGIQTIRKNPNTGAYEKLVSAEVAFTYTAVESSNKTSTFGQSSVLANGSWYRVAVRNDGIYKITPSFLQEAGMGSNVSIASLAVFGNGMGELPERNDDFRFDDLQENGTYVVDQNQDGIFNGSDYLLFYGRSPKRWVYDADGDVYNHRNNHYTDLNYYFITTDQGTGKRVGLVNYNPTNATHQVNDFDDHRFVEEDKVNLIGTGRRWFGDSYDFDLSHNYVFTIPNINTTEKVKIKTLAVARSARAGTTMRVENNGVPNTLLTFGSVGSGGAYVSERAERSDFFSANSNLALTVTYNNNINPSAVAWLDYIEIVARRNLVYIGGALQFRDARTLGATHIAQYNLSGANGNLMVWDVTNHVSPRSVNLTVQGGNANFKAPADTLREFIALSGSGFNEPPKVGKVNNQNLHALTGVDLVIVAHSSFISEAERLANFHRNGDNYNVVVVDNQTVFNEFSSGAQDVTAIKDFMRCLYTNAPTQEDKPTYLLLFGDASYDYKKRIDPDHNLVPIYESTASFSFYDSYATDDYFGYLDPGEGKNMYIESLDLSIGRLPVKNVNEARSAVDKIIHYQGSAETMNGWRNNILFVTDDVDLEWERILTTSPEAKSRQMEVKYPAFNYQKIYSDAYIQQSSAGSQRYPEARQELFRKVNAGNLMTVYVGHGGEVGWATERILQLEDINGWDNMDNMPVFVTITCEFSRLDDPKRVSAGEQLFNNRKGGGISLFSTTRVVNAPAALAINNIFMDTVFGKVDGEYQKMGDIIRHTKNETSGDVRLKFSLLGDPALKMAIPEYQVVNTHLNGQPMGLNNDTIKALGKVKMKGEVRDLAGNKLTNFNGLVYPEIFDKKVDKQTLVNDGKGAPVDFQQYENTIYRGTASVSGGDFEYEFIVPLDISYNVDKGKINYYSNNDDSDAHGSYTDVLVGGLNVSAGIDKIGPDIELFINDRSFVSGGITDANPVIFAELFDSSGINTVGNGIGHDIIAVLDDNTNNTFVLNDYYEADLNSYQSGKIQYPLSGLEPGEHKILFRVWDVYNNPSEMEIRFIVSESNNLQLSRVLNWPNPFTTYTEFQFEHNRASEPLDVQVQIFSVSGQIVKTINQRIQSTGNRVSGISWDGRDEYGDRIGKGVYVYKLKVRSGFDNAYSEKIEKLVILR